MLIIERRKQNFAIVIVVAAVVIGLMLSWVYLVKPVAAERTILFPVLGGGRYSNDYLSPRSGGPHYATDIMANKHTPIVSATDGTVTYVGYPQPSWGYMISIKDVDGYEYNYLHINNDNPGTDDGKGDGLNAYASDMKRGNKVVKGQLLGWVGDSGNAENTGSHLHFEVFRPDGSPVNPYELLKSAPIKYSVNRSDYPQLAGETLPYGPNEPGLNVAVGNFDTDSDVEIVTGAGVNGGPHVKIFEKNMTFTGKQFFSYNSQFRGGTDVAAGDLDGDGVDEIITGAGPGGGPHVRAFKPDGTIVASFFAYNQQFTGGVYVAAGDLDGDGVDEIITGAGPGGGPHVKIFKANGQEIGSSFPYTKQFTGGVDVAVGDVMGDTKSEIITSAGPGGGPHIRVATYSANTQESLRYTNSFFAYDSHSYHGGSRVSVGNVQTRTDKAEILTAPQSSGGPHIKMFDSNGSNITSKMFMEEWWYGSHDIGAGENFSIVGTGINRRASVRSAF